MSEKQKAVAACSCPREPGAVLEAPLCTVELDLGENTGPVFVTIPPQLACSNARRVSYGEFCLDENRIKVFRKYGI